MDSLTKILIYSIAIPGFIALVTGVVLLYLNFYLGKFKKVFKVNKRISKLTPEDFGMHPGNPRREGLLKFKASHIKRKSDGLIEKALNDNRSVLILGLPKIGKTRAAYEAIAKYKKWYIIRPKDERIDVDSIKFPLFFRLRKVILFFDDLEKFVDKNTEDFVKVIERRCKNIMILTTCRSGKEFGIIEGNKDLEYLFGECGKNQIELEEISNEQGISIAKTLGIKFDKNEFDNTPGSVALGIGDMKRRYHELPDIPKAIISALKLLRKGNIYSWPEDFVRNILKSKIFKMDISSSDWNTAINILKNQGLAFTAKGIVNISHDSYLGDTFIDDFPIENKLLIELRDVLFCLKDADNLFYLANGFYFRKELELSVDCLKFSIEINPNDSGAHNNLGFLFDDLQRYPEAESAYREAISIKPDYAEAHYNLGILLNNLQRYPEAESAYSEAIRIKLDYAEAHCNLGVLLYNLQRYPEAESAYREAIRIKPDYAKAHYNLGSLLDDLQRYPEGESAYREAIRINPDYAEAHSNLGVLLNNLQKYTEAESAYREAISIKPDFAEAHYNLGILLNNLQRYPEGESAYREAIRIKPDLAEAHYNLGFLLDDLQRYPEAESAYREAIRIKPDYAEAHNNLGVLLKNLQRYPEAESAYREAIRINPNYAEAHYNLGILLNNLQRYPEGESAYREAIRINPNYAEAHYNLGILLNNLQRYPEAESAYREAIRIKPDYAEAHNNLGILLGKLRRYPEAESAFREAIRITPDYANAHANLGITYKVWNKKEEAITSLEKAHALFEKQGRVEDVEHMDRLLTELE